MFWDPVYEHIANLVGAPVTQLKLISALLISFPLASLYVRLPHGRPNLAHIFSIVTATFFFVPLLGDLSGMIHLLVSCAVTYGIVVGSSSRKMPWAVFIFAMGHLMLNHARRVFGAIPEGAYDITFSQMVLAQKLTTFAWNVYDGRRKPEELDASQLATRLQHVPSPLAFLGYCFFFPSVLIGPSLEYATYDALVLGTLYDTPPPGVEDSQAKYRRRIPYGRKRVAYLHLAIGLCFLGAFSVYGGKASYERILTPSWYTWSWVTRIGFVNLAGFIARTKYYAVWSMSEGACILTGAGFNGYDPKTGRTLWNRLRNINILSIETSESFKVLFDSWNCRTNVWLRDCVYKRVTKKGRKPGSKESMATFLTSAVWHGTEAGYYLAFLTGGIAVSVGRQLRTYVRPHFLPPSNTPPSSPNSLPKWPYPNLRKRVYDIVGWALVQFHINYIACAFMLLNFSDCITAWKRLYFIGHVTMIAALVFFQAGGRRALRRSLPPKGAKGDVGSDVPSIKVAPPTPSDPPPPADERDPKDLTWVRHALDNPSHQDAGPGINADGGLVDNVMKGAETPFHGTPGRQMSPEL